jgi:hypothetical protein
MNRDCTVFGHPPVGELHFIENNGNKPAQFMLTWKTAGVKQTRSLAVPRFSRLAGESGAEANSLFRDCSATATEGTRRSMANRWLRKQETVKDKIGSRGVEPDSGWQ